MRERHVVIVGAGFGGLAAARALKGARDVQVTVVDRENHHLFQPLLYQVATASLPPQAIASPIRSSFRRQRNARVVLGEAAEVDREQRILTLRDGSTLRYDYLVVAAGAKTNYFGKWAEWGDHALGVKDLSDAIRIRERILLAFEAAEREEDPEVRARLLTFIAIGAGPTGVEMAGAISELGRQVLAKDYRRIAPNDIQVLLLERGDRVLSPFDPELSARALEHLEALGVTARFGCSVTDVDAEGVTYTNRKGEVVKVHAAVTCWATGVQPVSFAAKIGAATHRGKIVVDQHCALPSDRHVYAIGDIAHFVPTGEERGLPGLAPVAMQQGAHVAKAIASDVAGKSRPTFRYVDKGIMATVGRSAAVVEVGNFRAWGHFAWLTWCFVHVMLLIGFANRVLVMLAWTWSYVTMKRGARIITSGHDAAHENQDLDPRPRPMSESQ